MKPWAIASGKLRRISASLRCASTIGRSALVRAHTDSILAFIDSSPRCKSADAAVDANFFVGDPMAFLAREKGNHPGKILRLPDAERPAKGEVSWSRRHRTIRC